MGDALRGEPPKMPTTAMSAMITVQPKAGTRDRRGGLGGGLGDGFCFFGALEVAHLIIQYQQ